MSVHVVTKEQAIRQGVSSDSIFAVATWHRQRIDNHLMDKHDRNRHRLIAERLESLATSIP